MGTMRVILRYSENWESLGKPTKLMMTYINCRKNDSSLLNYLLSI